MLFFARGMATRVSPPSQLLVHLHLSICKRFFHQMPTSDLLVLDALAFLSYSTCQWLLPLFALFSLAALSVLLAFLHQLPSQLHRDIGRLLSSDLVPPRCNMENPINHLEEW